MKYRIESSTRAPDCKLAARILRRRGFDVELIDESTIATASAVGHSVGHSVGPFRLVPVEETD